ncbi:MAG: hypothetical protein ACLPZR_10345 [Solirubrobacteraceae bacterium]
MSFVSSAGHRSIHRARLVASGLVAVTIGLAALTGVGEAASTRHPAHAAHAERPLKVTVFSPGTGDVSGTGGAGFIVDLALDAADASGNAILSSSDGYQPFFNDPSSSTFHPGDDPGAPGLVVLLSSTPNKSGTPLQGPDTNLAGLFQLNGVANVGGLAETWNTWQVGKPLFGTGPATLTVYAVRGTAPTVVSPDTKPISNVVRVPFTIAP